MSATTETSAQLDDVVALIESATELDPWADAVLDRARSTIGAGTIGSFLRGEPLGQALHPILTDLPIGFWTAAVTLDLIMPRTSHVAARRLVGLGVLSAIPTAMAGWADGSALEGPEERRVAIVHAGGNAAATTMFALSWLRRRNGHHARGRAWALLGTAVATGAGMLGFRLAAARPGQILDDPLDDGLDDLVDGPPSTHLPRIGTS